MKHLTRRTIAIIVALLSSLALTLTVVSLPRQAYAVDGADAGGAAQGKRRRRHAARRTGAQHHHHQLRVWR